MVLMSHHARIFTALGVCRVAVPNAGASFFPVRRPEPRLFVCFL